MSPSGPWMTGVPDEGHIADLTAGNKQGKYKKMDFGVERWCRF